MEILLGIAAVLCVGGMNILCFLIGAKTGQQVSNNEPVEIPTLDPMKAYKEHREKKEQEKEQAKIDAIMRNIERYDGTGAGQEDVG